MKKEDTDWISDSFYIIPDKWNTFINYFQHQAGLYADEVFIRYYTEENGKPGYSSLTYSQINRISANLACEWHKNIYNNKAIAILFDHSSDLLISMLAVLKLRIPLLVLSPRNSKAAISNLLRTTKCSLLIVGDKYKKIGEDSANNVQECGFLSVSEYNLKFLAQQPLNDLVSTVLDNHFDDCDLDKISLILHSSGTTGFPKPVPLSNRSFLNQFTPHQKMIESGKSSDGVPDVFYACSPLFHSFGIGSFFSLLFNGSSCVFPKQLPPSQEDIEFAMKVNKCTITSMSPVIMKEMAEFCKGKDISHIQKLRSIMTGGAPILKDVGNWYHSNGVKICICYGSSETACTMTNDWDTTKDFTGELKPFILDPNGESWCHFEAFDCSNSNIKHLCIRSDLPALANVKKRDGLYETDDLFEETFKDSGYYHYIGRKDDTIVMSNGEKTNPVPMEQILNMNPVVKLSVVLGRGRQCTSVLIIVDDATTEGMGEREIMNQIQDSIKEVNQVSPSHSAIVPQMVKLLSPDTVIPFTPKGTFIRRRVEEMFDEILDGLYDAFLEGKQRSAKRLKIGVSSWNKKDTVQFLLQGAARVLDLHVEQIETDKSLFDLGLNSLRSIQLRNYISTQFDVDNNFIYHHSSILSMYEGIISEEGDLAKKSYDQTQKISQMYLEKAKKEFSTVITPPDRRNMLKVVLLTGVTGSLGAFILRQLLEDVNVKKVYCVVRGDRSKLWSRLEKSFLDRSLDTLLLSNKERVEPIALNFMDKYFGLDKTHFTKMKQEVTVVQHCGWLLDFNMPVEHFDKECIAPFYNLLRFSLKRTDPIPVHFVSSISASARLNPITIQETVLPIDSRIALPMGYAQSKFIVELLLSLLATEKNLPCYIHRVGQMYGDTENGVWNYSEQFPLMFIGGSSVMGVMPILNSVIDWLPVDYAAKIIVEIMSETYRGKTAQHIYHIVNPHILRWTDILDILKSSGISFNTVSLSEWINMLENSPNNPALALLPYYESMLESSGEMPIWETDNTRQVAPTMNHIPLLDSNLFKKFLVHWNSVKNL
ncbi:acetyl-CoA synthetase-like protein [Backusella circina FSU 941]|nr:acetyl-CoA synthetase-like protein [Backusella circina FSU 941]